VSNIDTKKENGVATIGQQEFWGSSNLDKNDFSVPRLKLQQKRDNAGKFEYNNGEVFTEMLACKLLVPRKTRVLYGTTTKSASRCKSDDFYSPSPNTKDPISTSCMNCYAAQWGDTDPNKISLFKDLNRTGKILNPLCNETYNLIMADAAWNPFSISFQKTGLKIVQEKLFSRIQRMGDAPFMVQFDMLVKSTAGPTGDDYYFIEFENFQAADQSDYDKGHTLWKALSESAKDIFAEQHEAMDQEKEINPEENNGTL